MICLEALLGVSPRESGAAAVSSSIELIRIGAEDEVASVRVSAPIPHHLSRAATSSCNLASTSQEP